MEYLTRKDNGLVYGHGNEENSTDGEIIDGIWWHKKSHYVWRDILEKCYSEKYHKINPSYIGYTVSKEWLYYANFEKWFDINYIKYIDGFQLDKDVLSGKLYSEDTCKFVSIQKTNSQFTEITFALETL